MRADELAKKGVGTSFTGPEPVLGLPYSVLSEQSGTGWRGSLAKTASTPRSSWKGLNKAGLINC